MNLFVVATNQLIKQFGANLTFRKVTQGAYNYTNASVTNTESDSTVLAYKRHVLANQYNYPNMVGKDVAEFYIPANQFSTYKPKNNDKVVDGGDVYTINKISEHGANGQVMLYCLMGVKS